MRYAQKAQGAFFSPPFSSSLSLSLSLSLSIPTATWTFLDLCNTAKDALLQTKECVYELQSILRRKGCYEFGLATEIKKYLTRKNTVNKAIRKALKGMQNKANFSTSNGDHETTSLQPFLTW